MAQLLQYKQTSETSGTASPSEIDTIEMDKRNGDYSNVAIVSPNKVKPSEHAEENGKAPLERLESHTVHTVEGDITIVDKTKDKEEEEKEKKKKEAAKTVGFFSLFRFADCIDVILMIIGAVAALCHGASLPGMIIVFGDMIDLFVNSGQFGDLLDTLVDNGFLAAIGITKNDILQNPNLLAPYVANLTAMNITDFSALSKEMESDMLDRMTMFAVYYIIIGCGVFVLGYMQVAFWAIASERQSHRIRFQFFRNILRQEIGWFDTNESGELNTRLSDDINKIHDGIGDKMGGLVQWMSSFLTGFIVGFIYGWKLTLVILAVSPILAACGGVMAKLVSTMTEKELKAYAKAGAIAEEVLGAHRTVSAFGGQAKECDRYNKNLEEARDFGIKKGFTNGMSMGIIWMVVFGVYALGFWYGAKLVRDEPENYTPGRVLIVFFAVIIGAFSIGNASPSGQAIATARGAAYFVYQIIDQVPSIDSSSEEGLKPKEVIGNIEFSNVHFNYPSREETKVLDNVSLKVDRGQTVALVGHSGCGKSTLVGLLQRFYDPQQGKVMVDGNNVSDLNVKWLRQHIGIVSQEPVLFGTTIEENIRYGREDVTIEEIEQAAKMANAHDFIKELPDKYQTLVGERGAQLSGGQKQRVAIARALVRDPKILLLDEATSALDTESEGVVQEALERASAGRTTIVVAHRLSTIKNADKIAGFKDGVLVEQGSHDELMKKGGIYYELVTLQTRKDGGDDLADLEEELRKEGRQSKRNLKSAHQLKRLTSITSEKDEPEEVTKEKKKKKEKAPPAPLKRIMRMNAPEWPYILLGSLASIINGGVQPAFAILFSVIIGTFAETDLEKQEREIALYCGILAGVGVVSMLTMFLQGYMFGKSGELLTMRVRTLTFKAMLRQNVSWFDDHQNNTGALTTRLATDASQVQGAAGIRVGMLVQNIANMGTALVIAFVYGWKLTLVILAFVPLVAIGGALQMKMLTGVAGKNKEALEDAGKVAVEAIENMRTVAGLTKEDKFHQLYIAKLMPPYRQALKSSHIQAVAFSISQAVIFFAYAASFWFGAWLIKQGEMDFVDVFKVFSAIMFGAMALGQTNSFAPDAAKAKLSAGHIFILLDRVPPIDVYDESGQKPESTFSSAVTFRDVKFRYPTRPDVEVLKGLNLIVNPGETVALVGTSGCGKSTTVSLTERFYDPEEGTVNLDKYSTLDLNIQWLRAQIGIVSQEPVLFDRSITENIAYGDNSRVVPMDEIIAAARKANIHRFIESLPQGYDTNVGEKGAQLSGGQKQRVAIARALVRNPKILLLDEATSALDTQSEQIVQEALDHAREGRTCIVIAHRLSTIQNADKIYVIREGIVKEEGKHGELMSKQGIYYKLNQAQMRQK